MVKIRTIEPQDFPVIAEFEKEISIISFGLEAITDLDFYKKKLAHSYKKEKDGMIVLICNDEIVGWICMAIKTNFITNEKYANFKSFYIKENYRGAEYSNLLMESGLDFCRQSGVKKIVGKVHIKNLAMRALYKNFNFEPTHITMEYMFN